MDFQKVTLVLSMFIIVASGQQFSDTPQLIEIAVLDGRVDQCPTNEQRQTALNDLNQNLRQILREIGQNWITTTPPCGGPEWRQVAFYNMTDPSYDCPPGLNLTSYSKRTCGRANSEEGCSSTTFSVNSSEYSQVCGRLNGYQVGPANAFWGYLNEQQPLEGYYAEGVSLTHGAAGSRQHIWTFAGGFSENDDRWPTAQCPCDSSNPATQSPPFVGDDYFCESARHTRWTNDFGVFYPDDTLWDGQDCISTSSCCHFNNPPWFTKTLPSFTTDDIELRVCKYNPWNIGDDQTPLELIELYVR